MVNVVGFSRGGTHLFWCFISSHSQLNSTKLEINDLVGLKRLGIIQKFKLEFCCLLGIYSGQFASINSNNVHKAVCSWYPNILFRILRRHDPMKYLSNTEFSKHKTIFLVKAAGAQKASWMRRGAPENIAEKAYIEHLNRWRLYSKDHDCLFIDYHVFCHDPIKTTEYIWSWLSLPIETFPQQIEIKPKAFKSQPNGLRADSKQRTWQLVDTEQLCASLKIDGQTVTPT
jgi:hypothetical protein